MFIRNTPYNSKTAALRLINSIKKAFINNFENIAWMNSVTRKLAEEKVNFMDTLIGYPDFIGDDKALNSKYKDLKIVEDDYFGNEIRLIEFTMKAEILTYREKVDRSE
jgi:predicted metalloendopeptidase